MRVEFRERQFKAFDDELEWFSIYVKMYCKSASIECAALNQKVETLHKYYHQRTLKDIRREFKDEAVLQFVKKLYDLRNSELFCAVWRRLGQDIQEKGPEALLNDSLMIDVSTSAAKRGSESSEGHDGPRWVPGILQPAASGLKRSGSMSNKQGSVTDVVVPLVIKDKKPHENVKELGVEFQCTQDCDAVALSRELSSLEVDRGTVNDTSKYKLTLWEVS
jgi:hypothetical protein